MGVSAPALDRTTAPLAIQNTEIRYVSTPTHDRSAESIRDRYRAFFDNAFMPNIRHEQMPGADERIAYAAEFAAYQLGQVDEKLRRLIELMESSAARRA